MFYAVSDLTSSSGSGFIFLIISSISWFACTFLLFFTILDIIHKSEINAKSRLHNEFVEQDYDLLRKDNLLFCLMESWLEELKEFMINSPKLEEVKHHLILLGMMPPWTPELFLAAKLLESVVVGIVIGALFLLFFNFFIFLFVACIIAMIYYFLMLANIKSKAKEQKQIIKLRLPFVIDLIALTQGAGASFRDSLEIVTVENHGHPVGNVFEKVLYEIDNGHLQREALSALSDKMQDPDFYEVIFAINKAEELGTPIVQTMSELAEQMRLKRLQWGEKMAHEAEVKILFPGMIIMLACLLVIVIPFILMAFSGDGGVM